MQLCRSVTSQVVPQLFQKLCAGMHQHDTNHFAPQVRIKLGRVLQEICHRRGSLDAGKAAADHHERKCCLLLLRTLKLGAFQLLDHMVAEIHGVLERFHCDCMCREARYLKKFADGTEGDHEIVV